MRTMMSRMDAIEVVQRRGIASVMQDNGDDEAESKTTRKEIEENMTVKDKMIRAINDIIGTPKLYTLLYSGSLNHKELIDWIGEMEKFSEFEQIRDHESLIC